MHVRACNAVGATEAALRKMEGMIVESMNAGTEIDAWHLAGETLWSYKAEALTLLVMVFALWGLADTVRRVLGLGGCWQFIVKKIRPIRSWSDLSQQERHDLGLFRHFCYVTKNSWQGNSNLYHTDLTCTRLNDSVLGRTVFRFEGCERCVPLTCHGLESAE